MPRTPFQKPWRSHAEQIALLVSRGLVVPDHAEAVAFLSHVNYYRLSGYCSAFEVKKDRFRPGTTFKQVRGTYEFDTLLRELVSEALQVVEVDLRTVIAHEFGRTHGAFGHVVPTSFYRSDPCAHGAWIAKLRQEADRSHERFVDHFRTRHVEFPDLPLWAVVEVMAFGGLSKMLDCMHLDDQRPIATRYRVQPRLLCKWIHHLSYVRNLCAHHARVWDRYWSIRPALPAGQEWQPPYLMDNGRMACTLLILSHLWSRCPAIGDRVIAWRGRVNACMAAPPAAAFAVARMGIMPAWFQNPVWQ